MKDLHFSLLIDFYGNILAPKMKDALELYYNEDLFKETGVKTPRELWKSGNWNWDTLKSTAQAISAKGYTGYINQQYNNLMLSAGHDYVSYDGKKFKSEITSENMIKALKK